jgi:hypothetical protein
VLLGLSVALVLVRVERNRAVGAAESERPQLAAV